MNGFPNVNALWAHAVLDACVANGVRRVVVSPGSRSAPLAIAAHAHPDLDFVLLPDERSAAFFALGQAIADDAPTALICTSGTAAANYLPAVSEASLARLPLVVLSADRPPALRGVGAAQTIDQLHLYGHAVRRFQDLPLPSLQPGALDAMTAQVALAVAAACSAPRGPVHVNVPFEEPLAPIEVAADEVARLDAGRRPAPRFRLGVARVADEALAEARERLAAARRPLLVAGPGARECGGEGLLAWAAACGMPVVADVGSNLRGLPAHGAVVTSHADAFLRQPDFESPDLVVRVGGAPTAKGVLTYLARLDAPVICLQPDVQGREGDVGAALVLVGDVEDAARRLAAGATQARDAGWAGRWAAADEDVRRVVESGRDVPGEALGVLGAIAALPVGGRLCLSNSLPVRHVETYANARALQGRHVHTFRGANGIDGVTSCALGIARASGDPTLLVTGDLAALHDVGGLLAARELTTPFALLVLNNDGGGIFSFLPIAEHAAAFEPLFGTPHGLGFEHAAKLYGLAYERLEDAGGVGDAVSRALARPGVGLVELVCRRDETASAQRAFMARTSRSVAVKP